jgi:hypothetical protein
LGLAQRVREGKRTHFTPILGLAQRVREGKQYTLHTHLGTCTVSERRETVHTSYPSWDLHRE